jgi:hypothetical protein
MPSLPPPRVERIGRFHVVRDDLLPGGSKMRYMLPLLAARPEREICYASPAEGFAQIALAHCCAALGKQAVVFVAQRKQPHRRTLAAHAAGARVFQVPNGRLNVVQARARLYAADKAAHLIPWGVDIPEALQAFSEAARSIPLQPLEVWACSGSGALIRGLQLAWPQASFHAVQVGALPNVGAARLWKAPEAYGEPARQPPPWPSCDNYDAKVWQFASRHAADEALLWNVAP